MTATPWSSVDHYENFPVASLLVPARLRPAMVALYRFAREADDLADEGQLAPSDRLAGLDALSQALRADTIREAEDPPCVTALRPHIAAHQLPVTELLALLSAFTQDVQVKRYQDRGALLAYCQRSACPIGRLMLRLFGADSTPNIDYADRICTALQLINFLQDIPLDWEKGRVYLPQQTLAQAGSSDADIARAVECGKPTTQLINAIASEARLAGSLLFEGRPLLRTVPWRLSLELRGILAGGQRILDRLANQGYNGFARRPTLGWRDAPALIRLALAPTR